MAIDARFTQDIIKQVDKVLAMKKAGSLTKWNAVQAIFDAQSLLQKRQVRNGQVMVHPKNRSGLGLNPHNVHKNLSVIKQVGADRQHLKKATAFEINPHGDKYHAQVKFNQDLVNSADGLLAPLTGSENLLSVACSHTVAGARAANASCVTPKEFGLRDANGRLSVQMLSENDPEMKDIIENGWVWTIIPYYAEVLWPELPDLAASALNAEHSTFSMASEVQVMVNLANYQAMNMSMTEASKRS